jgi:hypothetical protein
MARDFLNAEGTNLAELFEQSQFLADFRRMTSESSRGCILLEDPERLVDFLIEHQAIDSTSRQTVLEEYKKMTPCAGHNQAGEEIAETNPFYRMAKKKYFYGFGAYG